MLHAPSLRRSPWLLPSLVLALAPLAAAQIVFEPPVVTPLTHNTQGVLQADLNGDGHVDLLTQPRFEGAFQNPHFSALLGHGDGSFAPAITTVTSGEDAGRGALALLDGDANLDFALVHNVTGNEVLTIFSGAGDGSFRVSQDVSVPLSNTVAALEAVDLTGDGLLDIVMLNPGFVFFNTPLLIVAVANGSGGYGLVYGPAIQVGSSHFELGDLNGDGLLDAMITCAPSGTLTVQLGTGGGHFASPSNLVVGGSPNGLLLRDLDADGVLDLIYADTTGNRVVSALGNNAGHFTTLQSVAVAGGPVELSAGPLDPDGDLDLLVSDGTSGELSVLRGAGDGTFAVVTTVSHVPAAGGSALADFDEDGVVDAAVGTLTFPGSVAVLRNHTYGAGSPFTDLGHALAGSNGYPILLADGTLAAGSPGSLDLHGAAPGAGGNLWLGLSQLNKPFKGGVFVPFPLLPIHFVADGAGDVNLPFVFPSGVPAGTTLVFQYWITDAGAAHGFAASSGLLGVTP
jgi:FG-GAP-like repeat